MGTISSKDTRRISFNNTFTMNTALNIPKPMEDEDELSDLEVVSKEML